MTGPNAQEKRSGVTADKEDVGQTGKQSRRSMNSRNRTISHHVNGPRPYLNGHCVPLVLCILFCAVWIAVAEANIRA